MFVAIIGSIRGERDVAPTALTHEPAVACLRVMKERRSLETDLIPHVHQWEQQASAFATSASRTLFAIA